MLLSTMLAEEGIGEWGFAALVELGTRRILFDTGARPDTVWKNAQELGIDLSQVTDVILSHHHRDHIGGLLTLRRELRTGNPAALSRVHVGRGMFESRSNANSNGEKNAMLAIKREYEAMGGTFIEHEKPVELMKGVWLTGPVPRLHPERNWSGATQIHTTEGWIEDTIPESQSLVLDTTQGLVILSGCGHAGIVNTIEHARSKIREAPVYAMLGGFHLVEADDERLEWTGTQLRKFGLRHFLGAHCTGIEAVFQIRDHAHLDRKRCVVGAVGASFELSAGIDPLTLAR
ncbi:MAG: MBL fold metallo-hydrolase [Acidobacteria bacterium]|nr:MBL fold metallo-hydrolase [Acidobacteriota bacterium]